MTALLGIESDETTVRGRRRAEPPAPVCHRWKIVRRKPGLRVDEQVAQVPDKRRPHTDRIAELVRRLDAEAEPGGAAVLEIVRYFNVVESVEGASQSGGREKSNLFGWHPGRDVRAPPDRCVYAVRSGTR